MNRLMTTTSLGAALLLCASFAAPAQSSDAASTKADNTDVNKRDRKPGAVTADQQKMNKADRELTKKIRRAVIGDKSLSSYAHNVKIVSRDGMVTLKGPVRSEAEKTTIEAKAAEVAGGADKVKSLLAVKL